MGAMDSPVHASGVRTIGPGSSRPRPRYKTLFARSRPTMLHSWAMARAPAVLWCASPLQPLWRRQRHAVEARGHGMHASGWPISAEHTTFHIRHVSTRRHPHGRQRPTLPLYPLASEHHLLRHRDCRAAGHRRRAGRPPRDDYLWAHHSAGLRRRAARARGARLPLRGRLCGRRSPCAGRDRGRGRGDGQRGAARRLHQCRRWQYP